MRRGNTTIVGIFDWLDITLKDLTQRIIRGNPLELDFDALGISFPEIQLKNKPIEIRGTLERTVQRILREAGVQFHEKLNQEGTRIIEASVTANRAVNITERTKKSLNLAKSVWTIIGQSFTASDTAITLSTLIDGTLNTYGHFRQWDLNNALAILSSVELCSVFEPALSPTFVLGLLNRHAGLRREDHPSILAELKQVNRLAELRGEAMEIFTHLP